jgi:hypothetical protein
MALRGRRRRAWASASLLAVLSACGGGEHPCGNEEALLALDIAVFDATTGASICDAVVTTTERCDGGACVLPPQTFAGPGCIYASGISAGIYDVTVMKSGYLTTSVSAVQVMEGTVDECPILVPHHLTLSLTPTK